MSVKCQVVVEALDRLAPRSLAESWDNVGLLAGSPAQHIQKILVCLDVTEAVVDRAVAQGVHLIVSHHPLIFKPLLHLRTDNTQGRLLTKIIKADLAVFCAHTNLDSADCGVNDVLAGKLQLTDVVVLDGTHQEQLVKLVVFVPEEYVENVSDAVTRAGAGHIGRYSHCTFRTMGTGTFLPLAGTQPFIGEQGALARVAECRLETVMPEKISSRVVRALLKSHPYEEVAYDLYPLRNTGRALGLGRIGKLTQPFSLAQFAGRVKKMLALDHIRITGSVDKLVQKVAVCGGSGAGFIKRASFLGADVLVTGDVKYHEAQQALELGLAVVDAGHYATEVPVVESVACYLRQCAVDAKWSVEVLADTSCGDVFQTM